MTKVHENSPKWDGGSRSVRTQEEKKRKKEGNTRGVNRWRKINRYSPAKHQRPVARAKISMKTMRSSTRAPTTMPMIEPASKSTPENFVESHNDDRCSPFILSFNKLKQVKTNLENLECFFDTPRVYEREWDSNYTSHREICQKTLNYRNHAPVFECISIDREKKIKRNEGKPAERSKSSIFKTQSNWTSVRIKKEKEKEKSKCHRVLS